ncbi:unnamed protein product [Sphenostylis stenocarpa]|uniref:DUF1995 domain-containing protein n=1 Tax=Sphenostylis stenocarpa TaxID=92480 RepID=A0AA86TKB8_9FABA|nr:unnamed protein product [Sphenostylis stenocarpa]
MASSTIACNFHFTPFSLSFSHPLLCAYNGLSLHSSTSTFRVFAKFEKFPTESPEPDPPSTLEENTEASVKDDEEDDSCLPSDLDGAVRQSSEATAIFVSSGGMRATVELLIPQLQFLDDESAQVELWELSRIFLDTLIEKTKSKVSGMYYGGYKLIAYEIFEGIFEFEIIPIPSVLVIRRMHKRDGCAMITDFSPHDISIRKLDAHVMNTEFPEFAKRVKAIFPDAGAAALLKYRWKDAIFRFASHIAAIQHLAFSLEIARYVYRGKCSVMTRIGQIDICLPKEFESRDADDIEILFADEEQKPEQGQGFLDKAAGIFSSISRMMKSI